MRKKNKITIMRQSLKFILILLICFQSGLFAQNAPTKTAPKHVKLSIPTAGNSWVVSGSNTSKVINSRGISNWTNSDNIIRTYFYVIKPCRLTLAIDAKIETGTSVIKCSFDGNTKTIKLANTVFKPVQIGSMIIMQPGYYYVDMQGMKKDGKTFAQIKNLLMDDGADNSFIKFINEDFYFGRRGPSVHLFYQLQLPEKDIEWFYNEVEVKEGQDVIGSFFMANGFNEGYFGIQVISPTERRFLFSVWSPFKTNNPKSIPEDEKIKLMKKGENVYTGEFGNEGSGGQSYLRYNWKANQRYKFLLHCKPMDNNTTTYTAWFFNPETNEWKLIASFMRPKTNTYLKGLHSFLENFIPDTGNIDRKCGYYNQWVIDKEGNWFPINKVLMTADNTAVSQRRFDFSGGTENNGFYLRMGGFTNYNTTIYSKFVRLQTESIPIIDFDKLK